jgi:hypothetical protein
LNSLLNLFADDISLWPLQYGKAGFIHLIDSLVGMSRYAMDWKITYSSTKTQIVIFTHQPNINSIASPIPAFMLALLLILCHLILI